MGQASPPRAGRGAGPRRVPVRPALFTSTSSRFSSRRTAWAKARTEASELVSSRRSSTAGLPVAARISSTAAWPRSRLRHARMVRAFLRARSRATHLPIPAGHGAGAGLVPAWALWRGEPRGSVPAASRAHARRLRCCQEPGAEPRAPQPWSRGHQRGAEMGRQPWAAGSAGRGGTERDGDGAGRCGKEPRVADRRSSLGARLEHAAQTWSPSPHVALWQPCAVQRGPGGSSLGARQCGGRLAAWRPAGTGGTVLALAVSH